MFTIKIYAGGSTFIRSCNSVQIVSDQGETYTEECNKLKDDYIKSDIFDDVVAEEGGISLDAIIEHKLEEMMPYAFIHYDWDGRDSTWYLHGQDRAYVISEQGNTVEAITPPKFFIAAPDPLEKVEGGDGFGN